MYLFPISFIAQFIISALRAVLLIPGPHFPPLLSLTHIQSLVISGLGRSEAELTPGDTGPRSTLSWLRCVNLRPHLVNSAWSVVWVKWTDYVWSPLLCKHDEVMIISRDLEKCIETDSLVSRLCLTSEVRRRGWVNLWVNTSKLSKVHNDIWHSVCNSNKSNIYMYFVRTP